MNGGNQHLRKQLLWARLFTGVGILGLALLLAAAADGFRNGALTGIASGLSAGFLPTGAFSWILLRKGEHNPEFLKKLALEEEERNVFIRAKSGYAAFWATYGAVTFAVLLGSAVKLTFSAFGIALLLFMPAVYFGILARNHRRY